MGGLLDSVFGEKSESPKQQSLEYWKKVLSPFFESAQGQTDALFGAAQATQKDLFNLLGEGYGNARANVAQQGRMGQQGIMDAQTQALSASNQSAISAGLSGGTGQQNANRGIASDTSRAIGNLQSQLAQIYSGLDVGQAQAQAGALGGLSSLLTGQAGSAQNMLGLAFSGISGTPIQAGRQGGIAEGLGSLLKGFAAF
jgi:hypothetical protein